jgi:glycosyltransferase involved in cell wall biosynthesis
MKTECPACPRISVVIAAYNAEKYIGNAISSILSQSIPNWELLIVNDGSLDNTAEIAKSFRDPRVKVIDTQRIGPGGARNLAIKNAVGDFVVNLDADDWCSPLRLVSQIRFLQENSTCVAVGTNAEWVTESGKYLYRTDVPLEGSAVLNWSPPIGFVCASIAMRRSAFFEVGGYQEGSFFGEDTHLVRNLATVGDVRNISDCLYSVRLSCNSLSNFEAGKSNPRIMKSFHFNTLGNIYLTRSWNRRKAFLNFIAALRYCPGSIRVWVNLMLSCFPRVLIRALKRS